MSIRHLPGLDHERWYVITADRAKEEGRPSWQHHGVWLHGPNVTAHAEWNIFGRGFGLGAELGRNGDESDLGLSIYLGRLASVWLRLRSPWTRWARLGHGRPWEQVKEERPKDWYLPRHTSLRIFPFDGCLLSAEFDNPAHGHGRRQWTLTWWKILGRSRSEKTVLDEGSVDVPLPEGCYLATWERTEHVTRYTRWPGTWLDRVRGPRVQRWVGLDVPGGIPVEGKGESSYDCGMDGLFGCSGKTVEDAVGNAVSHVLRDRKRYGGPHDLTRPTTVSEASKS